MGAAAGDELTSRARFRLSHIGTSWVIRRAYISKRAAEELPVEKWKPDSYHARLRDALVYMLERLVAEGYKPTGLEQLIGRVDAAKAAILAWCEERANDKDAELEALP